MPEANQWNFHGDRLSHVRELRMALGDPDTMFAGIEVGGIVKSTAGGRSWHQLHGTHDDIHFVDISKAQAPYRSDDGGDRWEVINDELERRYTLHISSAPPGAGNCVLQRRPRKSPMLPFNGRREPQGFD